MGIATEPSVLGEEGSSEDVIHVDVTEWTSEDEMQVKKIDEERKPIQNLKMFLRHYDEYPTE